MNINELIWYKKNTYPQWFITQYKWSISTTCSKAEIKWNEKKMTNETKKKKNRKGNEKKINKNWYGTYEKKSIIKYSQWRWHSVQFLWSCYNMYECRLHAYVQARCVWLRCLCECIFRIDDFVFDSMLLQIESHPAQSNRNRNRCRRTRKTCTHKKRNGFNLI